MEGGEMDYASAKDKARIKGYTAIEPTKWLTIGVRPFSLVRDDKNDTWVIVDKDGTPVAVCMK